MDSNFVKPIIVTCQVGEVQFEVPIRFLYNSHIGVVQDGPLIGQLVMTIRERPSSKRFEEKQIGKSAAYLQKLLYFPYRDIYWLYRGIMHGKDGYRRDRKGEFYRLADALQSARSLHAELLSVKTQDQFIAVEEAMRSLIALVFLYLSPWVTNMVKIDGRSLSLHISKFKDSLGRKNAPALAARTVGLLNRLNEREDVIARSDSIFTLRKAILSHSISALDFEVNASADYFELLVGRWDEIIQSELLKFSVKSRMFYSMGLYRSIDIAPYRVTYQYAGNECSAILASLESGKYDDGFAVATRSLVGFRLRQQRSDLELVMQNVSRRAHCKDVGLDVEQCIGGIRVVQERIQSFDTSTLMGFNPTVVDTFLEQAISSLSSRSILDAHQALQQALVLL